MQLGNRAGLTAFLGRLFQSFDDTFQADDPVGVGSAMARRHGETICQRIELL